MSTLSCILTITMVLGVTVLADHSPNGKSIHVQHESTTKKAREKYMAWIERMGAKSHALVTTPGLVESMEAAQVIYVDKTPGKGNFQTVQAAVDSVPKNNPQRVVIQIAAGVYEEKVKIPKQKPYITFQGAGMDVTKITWHDNARNSDSTLQSATVAVMSPWFIGSNLAFENTSPVPKPGEVGGQAVAFQISGDQSALYNCAFYGAQDTLYDHKGRHYFKNCLIQGSVDFIFGDGQSLYEGCRLQTISTTYGSLTAQKRLSASENTGFSFLNSSVSGAGVAYLGRAWGEYSRVVFIYTYMDKIIVPEGWYNWGQASREQTVFYGQYQCSGPGAYSSSRVGWSHELTQAQAAPFMSMSFIDGQSWLPST